MAMPCGWLDAGLVVAVAVGDDGAVAGELADAVAVVVGDPDEAALIDGDAGGAIAAGVAGELSCRRGRPW